MDSQIFQLVHAQARRNAANACMVAQDGMVVTIRPKTRSTEQNGLLWSCLTDLSKQVAWSVNGKQEYLSPDDWKNICTASLNQENRMTAGIRGGFVILGRSTSKMSIRQMSELVDFIHAFGDEQSVKWSPTSVGGVVTC